MATHEHGAEDKIVQISELARAKLLEVLDDQKLRGLGSVRVTIKGRGAAGYEYSMSLKEDSQPDPGDAIQDEIDFKVLVDSETLPHLRGATVDFVDQFMGGGFKIDNPNTAWDDPMAADIQRLIDSQINPGVAMHGGHVELIDVKDNMVYVQLGGGCQGCGMVDVTLRQGIEHLIKQEFPQVQGVIDTTDHAGGSNPYYQPSKGAPEGQSPFYQPSKG